MGTQQISVRLPRELLEWAEAYGRSLRWDRTTVIRAALESFQEGVAGGVPDRPRERVVESASRSPERPVAREFPAGVMRGSPVSRDGEPNVDDFERTGDYRAAMQRFRAGQPWGHLKKASRR